MKYPERILIVLNPDGSLKVAQMEQLELDDDGKPIKQHVAEALTESALSVVLPDRASLVASLANEAARHGRALSEATSRLTSELTEKRSEVASLRAALGVAMARLAVLESGNG